MSNESPIPAKYYASMVSKLQSYKNPDDILESLFVEKIENNSSWHIEPNEGIIPPKAELKLKAICHLVDKKKYAAIELNRIS